MFYRPSTFYHTSFINIIETANKLIVFDNMCPGEYHWLRRSIGCSYSVGRTSYLWHNISCWTSSVNRQPALLLSLCCRHATNRLRPCHSTESAFFSSTIRWQKQLVSPSATATVVATNGVAGCSPHRPSIYRHCISRTPADQDNLLSTTG